MTWEFRQSPATVARMWSRGGTRLLGLGLVAASLSALATPAYAQRSQSSQPGRLEPAALRTELERRYDVVPVREGVVLRPRVTGSGIQSIEVTGGAIAIDGQVVTGAELRSRVAADADLVLQLSYMDDERRRVLFGFGAAVAASPTPVPAPPASPVLPAAPVAPPAAPAVPDVSTPADTTEPPQPPRPPRAGRGDRVRFGGSLTVDEGETVVGDVVVIGGSARVMGTVTGDVVVVWGSELYLGPKADVGKNAVVVGGRLVREQTARVGGEINEVSVAPWRRRGSVRAGPSEWWGRAWGSTFSLAATLIRVGVLCLLAALVMLLARDYTDRVTSRAVAEPVKAGAIGLLAQALFLPILVATIVLLAITIIGIPLLLLLPFALLGLMTFALAGFTSVAAHVGRVVTARFGWQDRGSIGTAVVGVLIVAAPVILARMVGLAGGPVWIMSMGLLIIGFLAEYLVWTIGIGAVALTRFSRDYTGGGTTTGFASPTGPVGPAPDGPLTPPADHTSLA